MNDLKQDYHVASNEARKSMASLQLAIGRLPDGDVLKSRTYLLLANMNSLVTEMYSLRDASDE